MKKIILLFLSLTFSLPAFAATGSIYNSSPEGLLPSAGTAEGSSYSTASGLGDNATGTASGSAYSTTLGFIASSITYSVIGPDNTPPTISNIRFDGQSVTSEGQVNNDVTITATITDDASGISTGTSSIEIDAGSPITFINLTGNSSYDASSGSLTYQPSPPFTAGQHSIRITARDSAGNSTSVLVTFTVKSAEIKSTAAVLNYPNPFNPSDGPTEITYRLNSNADVTVYIFNTTGNLIWRNDYPSGQMGGQADNNSILWNGLSNSGQVVDNGVYICQIIAGGKIIGRCKIAVLK